jgi:hypothetical protein
MPNPVVLNNVFDLYDKGQKIGRVSTDFVKRQGGVQSLESQGFILRRVS